MRFLPSLVLLLAACTAELPPEQLAVRRAETLLHRAGHANATLLAPLAGLDGDGMPGVCGLVETPAGPVRVVVALASGMVSTGVPATQGAHRQDLGESRYCSDKALKRWEQAKKGDPIGLVARLGA